MISLFGASELKFEVMLKNWNVCDASDEFLSIAFIVCADSKQHQVNGGALKQFSIDCRDVSTTYYTVCNVTNLASIFQRAQLMGERKKHIETTTTKHTSLLWRMSLLFMFVKLFV